MGMKPDVKVFAQLLCKRHIKHADYYDIKSVVIYFVAKFQIFVIYLVYKMERHS